MTDKEFLDYMKKYAKKKTFNINNFFLDDSHKKRYSNLLTRDSRDYESTYHESLFYIIAGNNDLYRNVDYIYNFDTHSLNNSKYNDIFESEFLTGTSTNLLIIATDLFTSKNLHNRSISHIFSNLSFENFELAINALRIRYRQFS